MRITTIASATVLAMAAVGLTGPAAHAAPAEPARHCVVDLDDGAVNCYDTFGEALADATGGRVTALPEDLDKAVGEANAAAKSGAGLLGGGTDLTLSIEYEDEDFDDSTLTAKGSHECTTDYYDTDYYMPELGSYWNDEIDSFRAYSNCWVKHFEHSEFRGAWIGPSGDQSDMGWMHDKASSIVWT
ncbi:MAG TPA: hypothetical protein VGF17_28725 [Phytomonospora sp.]